MTEHNVHAGIPFTDDDETIAAALEDVSIPTLMLSMVHMSGDPEILRGRLRPQGLFLNEVQGFMSEEDKAEVRALALGVIRNYRDGGCLKALIQGSHRSMEPREEVHDDYYERTQKDLLGLVWSHPSIEHSWYKNADGEIHILSPWRLVDYWNWTREPDLGDFNFES